MIEQARQNTGATTAVLTVADGGYGSGAQVDQAETRNLNVLVQPQEGTSRKPEAYQARAFHYDSEHKTVLCPQKQSLSYVGKLKQKGQIVQRYRCQIKDCPVAHLCKDRRGRRVIEIWSHTPAVQRMRQRLKSREALELLARRGTIIEKHFGHIKQHDGFRRWTVRGVENVRTQWALINLTMNLRVLAKHWTIKNNDLN